MRLLGDNGAGYELAQRIEENGVWRTWLGERDYAVLQSYLATPGTWSAFMQSENPNVTALQLRVRALIFDKALISLYLDSAASSPPSALDNSFLQLHADSVYFSLEQDAEDWARLQAEKSPALTSLELKYGLDPAERYTRLIDGDSGHGGINSRLMKASQSGHSVSSALISPTQQTSRTHAKMGFNIAGSLIDYRTLGELWYTQCLQRNLMNRMNRLARRIAQRRLAFGEQEACLRTPAEMADYVTSQENHRKRRPVFRMDGEFMSSNTGASAGLSSVSGVQYPESTERDVFSSKLSQPGLERSLQGGDDNAQFFPEFQYPGNCVPDNAVSARQSPLVDGFSASGKSLDRLNHLQDLTSGNSIVGGYTKEISEDAAQQLAQKAVARLVAAAGFEGLKQAPLQILVDLLACHVRKLGSGLRLIVDTYKRDCSQAELLNMYIHGASGSNLGELVKFAKSVQPSQKRRPAPVQTPQPTIQQALVQQQISPHPTSMPVKMPYLHDQAQQVQPGQEMLTKRRQSSSPGGSNKGDRFDRVASDTTSSGEIGIDPPTLPSGLSEMLNQPLSQGHMSWGSQAANFAGLPRVNQRPMLQHFKQQLSSLQIPSLQQQTLYVKDSGALKLPSSQVQGFGDTSVSVKQEMDDHNEGSQFSPNRLKRRQHLRSWG